MDSTKSKIKSLEKVDILPVDQVLPTETFEIIYEDDQKKKTSRPENSVKLNSVGKFINQFPDNVNN